VFHTEKYGQCRKTYNSGVYVKGSTSNKFEVDYHRKLDKVIELQYHRDRIEYFYSNAIGMIPLIEELE
jgi:S-methylmethionine-dependent homocysteine/selenocysteine methylase